MNTIKTKHRILSGVMACVLGAMSVYTPGLVVLAAPAAEYNIRFYDDKAIQKESINQRIVEGSDISIRTKLPDGYKISTVTPFAVKESGVEGDASHNFNITQATNPVYYTLKAKAGSAGASAKEYTINAIYTANLSKGSGTGDYYKAAVPPSTEEIRNHYVLDITVKGGISITEDSSITFQANGNEGDDGMVSYDKVSAATGGLRQYQGGIVSATALKNGSSVFTIQPGPGATDPTVLQMDVAFEGGAKIQSGTEFTINFRRETINSLIATVITVPQALQETVESVKSNPTSPEITGTGVPYMKFADGDTLESITANFELLSRIHRDNVDVELAWAWVPDPTPPGITSVIRLKPGLGKIGVEIVERPSDGSDIKGHFTVTAKYGGVDSPTMDIPVVIYGSGSLANLLPLKSTTGNPGGAPIVTDITKIPTRMDVYQGDADVLFYNKVPAGPFRFTGLISFGNGTGRAEKAVIRTQSQGGEVQVMLDNNVVPYTLGTDIPNKGMGVPVEVTATKGGPVNFIVEFYNAKGDLMARNTVNQRIDVVDSRPSTDARLADMGIFLKGADADEQKVINSVYPSGLLTYAFDPDKNVWDITVPYKAAEVQMRPRIPVGTRAQQDVVIDYGDGPKDITSGKETVPIPLTPELPKTVTATVTAEDGSTNTYTFNIVRSAKDTKSGLKGLQVFRTDTMQELPLTPPFATATKEYAITVPYKVKEVELKIDTESPWVSDVAFVPAPKVVGFWFWKTEVLKFDLTCDFDPVTGEVSNNVNLITVEVTAEDGVGKTKYNLRVTRLAPSVDNTLASLEIKDKNNKTIPFDEGMKFDPNVRDYYVHVPYSALLVNIEAKANHSEAMQISMLAPSVYGGKRSDAVPKKDAVTVFRNIDISQNVQTPDPAKNEFIYAVLVKAESGDDTSPPYNIHFVRDDPDADTRLESLAVVDQDSKALENFSFNKEQLEYTVDVPYGVTRATITPKAVSPLAKVTVDGAEMNTGRTSVTVEIPVGSSKTVRIVVTAESAASRTYILHLQRGVPSSEARLSDLTVSDSIPLSPKFSLIRLNYEIVIPEKTKGITLTPTAIDPFATITVNGKAVASGAASAVIRPTEVITQIPIEVTAQDGRTKVRYVVTARDENLVEKSSNADLQSIRVYDGAVSPRFKAGIDAYEIALKPDARSVDLVPKPADANATVEVKAGTRVLEKYGDEYSTSITDDETKFTVTVTAPDKIAVKEYQFVAYRNNEEKAGAYTPITADMVDFTAESPIHVDISKYPIVSADVFNTLRTEHPDKSIVFEGNGYSLEIAGKDILTLVPNTAQFDLSMSFNGPNNQLIQNLIYALDGRNATLSPVIIHFGHHGALPGAMRFTVSLGGFYKNLRMYWNYHNAEYNSIDYYGYVGTNAQGVLSVPLTHMSDYAITTGMIYGSENKVGALGSTGENLGNATTSGKKNPQTQSRAFGTADAGRGAHSLLAILPKKEEQEEDNE